MTAKTFWNYLDENTAIGLGDAPLPRLCLVSQAEWDQWVGQPGRSLEALAEAWEVIRDVDAKGKSSVRN